MREPRALRRQVLAKGRFQVNTPKNVPTNSAAQEVDGMHIQGHSLAVILYKEKPEKGEEENSV